MDISFINALESRLAQSLPGMDAQARLAPVYHRKYLEPHNDHRIACVLLLLFPKNNEWNICYIQRSNSNPDDRHAGQISFPGGKYEESDGTFEACALRETYEEIGVRPENVGILGQLSELYVYVSRFKVYPFVGFTQDPAEFQLQLSEVRSVIEVPVSHLFNDATIKKGTIQVRDYSRDNVPYYDLFGSKLWGATAMITSEFIELCREIPMISNGKTT